MITEFLVTPLLAEFTFEKQATTGTIAFEVFVLLGSAIGFFILRRLTDKVGWRLLATGAAVLIFELFTGPMWINERMGPWAYLYLDLSWILTIGWTFLILGVVVLVDRFLETWRAPARFLIYLLALLLIVAPLEILVVNLGIRSYSPEVLQATSGVQIMGAPIEILFYVPVFTALVITFYKYWSFQIDRVPLIPVHKRKWGRALLIAFLGVFLFEVMVEPMIENRNFPQWSYVYHDISILLTGTWIVMLAVAGVLVERYLAVFPVPLRFVGAIFIIGCLALPLESWLALNGYRVYGPSMEQAFTGFRTPITGIASEVAMAIPCYLSLIVGFIRYWEIVFDNGM